MRSPPLIDNNSRGLLESAGYEVLIIVREGQQVDPTTMDTPQDLVVI